MTPVEILTEALHLIQTKGLGRLRFFDRATGQYCLIGALRQAAFKNPIPTWSAPQENYSAYLTTYQAVEATVPRISPHWGMLGVWSDRSAPGEVELALEQAIGNEGQL